MKTQEVMKREVDLINLCDHLWACRREGTWCVRCRQTRFGVELSEQERRKLVRMREREVRRETTQGQVTE